MVSDGYYVIEGEVAVDVQKKCFDCNGSVLLLL